MTKAFGELFKRHRLSTGQTLRGFCIRNGFDAGNISKMERGLLPPPQSEEKLRKYAEALKIPEGSEQFRDFIDLGLSCAGQLSKDILADEELVSKLPALLRTVSGKKLTTAELDQLIDEIRRT